MATLATRKIEIAKPDAKHTWLALSAEIRRAEEHLFMLKAQRQGIKPELMRGMGQWGLSDTMLTAELLR